MPSSELACNDICALSRTQILDCYTNIIPKCLISRLG